MVHRYAPLALIDQHDADDREQSQQDERQPCRRCLRGRAAIQQLPTDDRQTRDDAAEDDDRDAVADAVLGDQFTEPDQESVPATSVSRIAASSAPCRG